MDGAGLDSGLLDVGLILPTRFVMLYNSSLGFLTGVLQTNSRKYKVAIDKLSFKFKLLDVEVEKVKEEPKDGVYVWGLYLEAARWDSQHETLVDQSLG